MKINGFCFYQSTSDPDWSSIPAGIAQEDRENKAGQRPTNGVATRIREHCFITIRPP